MVELVNKYHPDKVADRIAGALVDLAYYFSNNPKVAIEVLIGHGVCHIINETDTHLPIEKVNEIVARIAGNVKVDYVEVPQDEDLAHNQETLHCGDNGIFKGVPLTLEQKELVLIREQLENAFPSDGKYILDKDTNNLVICQSNAKDKDIRNLLKVYNYGKTVNPLGYWSGGTNVDCGATNRKLGSDMADSITGGGLHGKDLSKADVSVNIYCFLEAQKLKRAVQAYCAIGDDIVFVDGIPMSFEMIVKVASDYVFGTLGGFEKLAEHGLVR